MNDVFPFICLFIIINEIHAPNIPITAPTPNVMTSNAYNVLKKLDNIPVIESNGVIITGSASVHISIGNPII
jgi:hypothetical protein